MIRVIRLKSEQESFKKRFAAKLVPVVVVSYLVSLLLAISVTRKKIANCL